MGVADHGVSLYLGMRIFIIHQLIPPFLFSACGFCWQDNFDGVKPLFLKKIIICFLGFYQADIVDHKLHLKAYFFLFLLMLVN